MEKCYLVLAFGFLYTFLFLSPEKSFSQKYHSKSYFKKNYPGYVSVGRKGLTSNFFFGVKGGLAYSDITGTLLIQAERQDSYNPVLFTTGGLVAISNLSDLFSLKGELNYLTRGSNYESVGDWETIISNIYREYIEMPVALNINFFSPLSTFKPALYAGGSVSYLLSAKKTDIVYENVDLIEYYREEGIDVKESFNTIDYGLVLGGSCNVFIKRNLMLIFDLKSYLGFANINKYPSEEAQQVFTRNIEMVFSTGILFGN
ncbi:porin family protein [Flammeovirgaceae bacterium SG7u.111]|nr:porin family protein [Flammeovirgaceae bacterium SG7u.132]WPO36948.1 porin family protein [Flammeovirgaceae bacterium SG7u.111]